LGRTHFIVGYPHEKIAQTHTAKDVQQQYHFHPDQRAYFSPDDDIASRLVECIDKEMHAIQGAIFVFTSDPIAQALVRAQARGVAVELIVDGNYKSDRFSKVHRLKEAGIKVFEYDPAHITDMRSNIMHNKFMIFGSHGDVNTNDQSYVFTGSFNWTNAATQRNQENALIIYDPTIVERYRTQFALMKCERCVGCRKKNG
jgi:phosphatidylserine/phosphatidylglycerophosphate/cardiolipin synthase-like enzyme